MKIIVSVFFLIFSGKAFCLENGERYSILLEGDYGCVVGYLYRLSLNEENSNLLLEVKSSLGSETYTLDKNEEKEIKSLIDSINDKNFPREIGRSVFTGDFYGVFMVGATYKGVAKERKANIKFGEIENTEIKTLLVKLMSYLKNRDLRLVIN